jgi:hypothetical protein
MAGRRRRHRAVHVELISQATGLPASFLIMDGDTLHVDLKGVVQDRRGGVEIISVPVTIKAHCA